MESRPTFVATAQPVCLPFGRDLSPVQASHHSDLPKPFPRSHSVSTTLSPHLETDVKPPETLREPSLVLLNLTHRRRRIVIEISDPLRALI